MSDGRICDGCGKSATTALADHAWIRLSTQWSGGRMRYDGTPKMHTGDACSADCAPVIIRGWQDEERAYQNSMRELYERQRRSATAGNAKADARDPWWAVWRRFGFARKEAK